MSNGGDVSQPGSRQPIRYGTLLVVEGRDTFGFFLALLKELGLVNRVEVRNGGGVPDLYDYLAVLPNISGFDAVTSLGVVCDCETDPAAAFREPLPGPAASRSPGPHRGTATHRCPSPAARAGRPVAGCRHPRHAGDAPVASTGR